MPKRYKMHRPPPFGVKTSCLQSSDVDIALVTSHLLGIKARKPFRVDLYLKFPATEKWRKWDDTREGCDKPYLPSNLLYSAQEAVGSK
ncbi:hypothetical protein NPIL_418571 [Nephila pilipes]|uniref:Uncharacterized protein n=1 Tax=Nephila pilipes TaxID=299642 RepID=A0A8X6J9S1_NEPPI|nr:hypothetical protein NPIL_418571 [Nephila pilipes]